MAVGKEAFCTSEVSHSNKIYHKNIYINKKSFTALFLSAALFLTSVDCMKVQAEELKDQVPPAQTEDTGEPGSVSENTLPEEEGTTGPDYVKNADGAVIITSFEDLPEDVGHIELGEEETLEEAVGRMPATLKAYADVYVAAEKPGTDESDEPGKEEDKPDAGGEEQPDDEENKPDTGEEEQPGEGEEGQPGENEGDNTGDDQGGETDGEQPGEGEEDGGTDGGQPGEGEGDSGADGGQPDEGEGDNGTDCGQPDGEEQPDEGNDGDGADGGQSGEGEGDNGTDSEQAGDIAAVNAGKSLAVQDEYRWRLLVAADESADRTDNGSSQTGAEGGSGGEGGENRQPDESGGDSGEGQQPEGGDNGGNQQPGDGGDGENGGGLRPDDGGGENDGSGQPGTGTPPGTEETPGTEGTSGADDGENVGDRPAADGGAGEETLTPTIKNVEIEGGIPVRWECREAGDEELEEYIFRPTWDETRWVFAGDTDAGDVPTIVVTGFEKEPAFEVSTEEELAAAFAAGLSYVALRNDIFLTAPLALPATANMELDGQGYSLFRGERKNEETGSGGVFTGIMISLDGEDYTEETYGTLTLKDITVDGKTKDGRADAPAILDRGNLILEEKSVVRDNDNFGTYPSEENADVETVLDYGGGIQVYGELTVTEEALVTGNFADELGGGVYLENGAALYLYADVIRDNSVAFDHGYGADIYAASGSTIYYDSSIDMTREGFYFCEGVVLIPMGIQAFDEPAANQKEIFVSVAKDSGYTEEQVREIKQALEAKGYTIISSKRTDIDTTDLRDWYVYDHYDTHERCWGIGVMGNPSDKWTQEYGDQQKRKYYAYYEDYIYDAIADDKQAVTIEEWLARENEYRENTPLRRWRLSHFKEHIYTRMQDGEPTMTFVGYGKPAYVDFLFYDPESAGEKVVDFNIDSTLVNVHTLAGNGFLVNTSIAGRRLYGYLVYYAYEEDDSHIAKANEVQLLALNGIDIDSLHQGTWDFRDPDCFSDSANFRKIAIRSFNNWQNQMCIQITATPKKIEVRQQPKSWTSDISQSQPLISYSIPDGSGIVGNSFGPLVAYTTDSGTHQCSLASSFTYSNLRMYFTNPVLERKDMLNPLEEADFTQAGTQKYFLNLFGQSELKYNDTVNFGQYQEYMEMMQNEGIALITDRETPFSRYLGETNTEDSNLFEVEQNGGLLSVEELVQKVDDFISKKNPQSTSLKEKVEQGELKEPELRQSVGNIWLKSAANSAQIRNLYSDTVDENGYMIQIMDDIAYYYKNPSDPQVYYDIYKPGASGYTTLWSGVSSDARMVPFTVTKDEDEWPSGMYTVRQRIGNSSIRGYAYFNVAWDQESPIPPTPPEPEEPDPPTPPEPEEPDPPTPPEPEEPDPPTPPGPDKPDPPAPDKPAKPGKPSKSPSKPSGSSEPVAEPYVEETIEVSALEPVGTVVPAPKEQEEPEEKSPKEPRTGDMPVATMPVSVGACTAFMMKLRLWLYELETGISEEKKNEILRILVGWAKGGAMIKVYMAIAATALVLTAYHLLRALDAKRRQALAWFGR